MLMKECKSVISLREMKLAVDFLFLFSVSDVPPLIQGSHPYPSAPGNL